MTLDPNIWSKLPRELIGLIFKYADYQCLISFYKITFNGDSIIYNLINESLVYEQSITHIDFDCWVIWFDMYNYDDYTYYFNKFIKLKGQCYFRSQRYLKSRIVLANNLKIQKKTKCLLS